MGSPDLGSEALGRNLDRMMKGKRTPTYGKVWLDDLIYGPATDGAQVESDWIEIARAALDQAGRQDLIDAIDDAEVAAEETRFQCFGEGPPRCDCPECRS